MNDYATRRMQIEMERRKRAYLSAIEPITQARVRLAMLHLRHTFFVATGTTHSDLPPDIQAINDQYAAMQDAIKAQYLATELRPGGSREMPYGAER
jgi:hypothetical protein